MDVVPTPSACELAPLAKLGAGLSSGSTPPPSTWEARPLAELPSPSAWALMAVVCVEVLKPSVCERAPQACVPNPSEWASRPAASVVEPSACELSPIALVK